MKKWSLNNKVSLILSIFILGGAIISVAGFIGMKSLNVALIDIVTKNAKRVDIAHQIETTFALLSLTEKNYILVPEKEGKAKYRTRAEGYRADVVRLVKEYEVVSDDFGKRQMDEFYATYKEWESVDSEVMRLSDLGDEKGAFNVSSVNAKEIRNKSEKFLKTLVTNNQNEMTMESENAHKIYEEAKDVMIAVSVSALIAGIVSAFFIMKALSKTINEVVSDLSSSSNEVSTAAHQIAASSEELSSSVAQQSSSLAQTAAAVEELNSVIQRNADYAQKTSDLARESKDSATKGKSVVVEMVHAIDDINASNEKIMESINESNAKMSQIINVIHEIEDKTKIIHDIVFQTKLLSFNASVEAARAGQHGLGFSVVASEIGTLAEKSGASAKDITIMLDASKKKVELIVADTKSKVETLVMSGKLKVEVGLKIAKECDVVLDEIVTNVASVTSMAQEISSASGEQAIGVQEINKAITQLDSVTQNNASASQQTAGAASELSAQSHALTGVVGVLVDVIHGSSNQVEGRETRVVSEDNMYLKAA